MIFSTDWNLINFVLRLSFNLDYSIGNIRKFIEDPFQGNSHHFLLFANGRHETVSSITSSSTCTTFRFVWRLITSHSHCNRKSSNSTK